MSTLQHTYQRTLGTRSWNRVVIAAVLAVVVAGTAVALILAFSGGSSSALTGSPGVAHPSQAQVQRELEAVSGARYGLSSAHRAAPARQPSELESYSGARFGQPGGYNPR